MEFCNCNNLSERITCHMVTAESQRLAVTIVTWKTDSLAESMGKNLGLENKVEGICDYFCDNNHP